MTPRQALTRALYLRPVPGMRRTDEMFEAAWAWAHDERNAPHLKDSAIGQAIAQAEKVLRLLEAAGIRAEVME